MANQPAPGVLEVRLQYLSDGEKCENVYHVHHGSSIAWPEADIEDVLSTFENWEDTTASLLRPTDVSLYNMVGSDLTSLTAFRRSRAVSPAIVGSIASDSLPNNATMAITFNTGNRGKGQNGRQFWIGLTENHVTGNSVEAAHRDSIISALEALDAAIQTLDPAYRLVVLHRVVNGVHPPTAGTTNVLSFSTADLIVDSQKNRLPNHKKRKRAA